MTELYKGPVCYVGHDHEAADGRQLDGGWHYTVIDTPDGSGNTMPGEKLVALKSGYRLATDKDKSHREQHHERLTLVAVDGALGEPRTDEEIEAAHRHLDELEERLASEGLHEQEHGHVLTTKQEIHVMRGWLKRGRG